MKTQLRIVAAADSGIYIGVDADFGYWVLSLSSGQAPDPGDTVVGNLRECLGTFCTMINLTRRSSVAVHVDNWECSAQQAVDCALGLLDANPCAVVCESKRFMSGADDVSGQLAREISRA